jgi:hypothetical protein
MQENHGPVAAPQIDLVEMIRLEQNVAEGNSPLQVVARRANLPTERGILSA